jgi:ComEC/Rec2-related protein
MLWPYAFFTFVALVLFKSGFPAAGIISATTAAGFLIVDFRRADRKLFIVSLAGGIVLGAWLFTLRLGVLSTPVALPLSGEAQIVGVSRKSVVIQNDQRIKLRLTGLKKEQLPTKQARISYRCTVQDVPESTFMVFERLSGVAAWCRVSEMQTLKKPEGFLVSFRAKTLDYLHAKFERMGERSLIAAFLLGDTEDLTPQELDAFRDMGLMHLFAVSGLNIALLFAILYLPFRFAGIPSVGAALGYAVATAFLLLLDFPVPLLRAWLFMTIGLGMRLLDRRIPSWVLLFLTAIVVELLFPLSTFSMSFILSFGITAAILIFYEPLHFCFAAKNKLLNLLSEHTALTLAAGLPALLLGYLLFGSAQPLSLLYNLLLVPFSGLYLFTSLVFIAFEPAKYLLFALDALYLKFAAWHTAYVSAVFPSAEKNTQIASLIFIALALIVLYILKIRHRLWSARRHLRYILPVSSIILFLPYFLATYPAEAIYAVPNKVWIYSDRKIISTGSQLFSDGRSNEPKYCFPIKVKNELAQQKNQPAEILISGNRCFVFTGRMKPETWAPDILVRCASLHVFQSKKMQTSSTEWDQMFRLFGYRGKVAIRKFFTWYADKPLACGKSEKL